MSKDKFKMRNRIKEIDARIVVLADTLETEKRGLTSDEKAERDALVSEKEILQLRSERFNRGEYVTEQEATNERAFAEAVTSICRRQPVSEDYAGFVINNEIAIPVTRSAQDSSSVSPLIPLTIGEIIQPLEKGLILDKVGCKMQYGLVGDWVLPVVAGVEATIEDENAEVSDQTIDISALKPTPKRVALSIPVSNSAIDQSNDMLLEVVNTQMRMGLTRLLNRWMFAPEKITSKASDGCFVSPSSSMTVKELTYKAATKLKGRVMKKGVCFDGSAAYVCSATTYADLEATPRSTGGERMVIEDGKINGFPVFQTEYIGDDLLGFGIFNYELVGQFGKMRIVVDPYTGAKKNLTYFVLNTAFDMLSVRSEAFGICKVSNAPTIASDPTAVKINSTTNTESSLEIDVTGVNLTTDISAVVTGADKSLFTLSAAKLTKGDGGVVDSKITIKYKPTVIGSHSAILTLSADGATSVAVDLSGVCK